MFEQKLEGSREELWGKGFPGKRDSEDEIINKTVCAEQSETSTAGAW